MAEGLTAAEILAAPGVREQVDAHAMAWFPSECCGLLTDGPEGPAAVLLENLADKYHALDPEMYPRSAHIAYILNPMKILAEEESGRRVVAIFHSHCGFGSYFSDEDVEQALAPRFDDEDPIAPRYPGVDYVVLNAHEDGVRGYRSFRFDEATGGFAEVARAGDIRGTNEAG